MLTLDEIEALLVQDDSRSRAGHIIQVRRETEEMIRLVAVPFLPVPSNIGFVSYVLFIGSDGRPRLVRSVNWFFPLAFLLLLSLLLSSMLSGRRSDMRELPWLLGCVSVYLALKSIGIWTLRRYGADIRHRFEIQSE